MRIDSHQHFWRYTPDEYGWIDESMQALRRDFLPDDLKPELKRCGVDASIVVQACHTLDETRWLLQLAADDPQVAGVIGWVDLRSVDVRAQLLEFAGNSKLVGVRHVVQAEPNDRFLLQPEFLRGVATLEEFGLTYDILIYTKHLPVAAEFVSRFPRQRFVLDHLAKPPIKAQQFQPWESGIRALAKFQNVFCKLSGLVTEADWKVWKPEHVTPFLDVAFDAFGPERLMIGSDWPVCTVAASYSQTMGLVENYLSRFPTSVREAVLGQNAERFWNLTGGLQATSNRRSKALT
jgi:L-fuconolactonase